MNEYDIIIGFIEWIHEKCFTIEGIVMEDIKHMVNIYLKEIE